MLLGTMSAAMLHNSIPAAAGRDALSITTNNDAQVDTSFYAHPTGSLLVDGTDYLEVDNSGNELDLGSGDWTIEFWIRPAALPGSSDYDFIYDARETGTGTQPSILLNDSKVKFYTAGGFRISSSTSLSANTWYHIALVKSGSTTTLYQDGTSVGTYSDSNTYTARDGVKIGINFNNVNGYDGHIDEFRVSDTARYTANFTRDAQNEHTNDSNTLLLIHMDGTDASTTFEDDNG